ncbi:MAG: glucose-6-phosphate isomerase [Clostridia bacterium]|nr:glucose-6-phosphate isomerase [Clostridia bacterium]
MKLDFENSLVSEEEIIKFDKKIIKAHEELHKDTTNINDFKGWVELEFDSEEIERIKTIADRIRSNSKILVVVGIGGSYLGARAVIEALSNNFEKSNVLYAGNNMNPDYMNDLLDYLNDKNFSINVISKSGTTTEPAIAFELLKELLIKKYGEEEASGRIYVTTDKEKGVLRKEANEKGYETFVIPDNIGGRYSVLTPVGLLPIAAAGIDIDKIISGAKAAMERYANVEDNECYKYAILRNILYKKGKKIEILASYEPKLQYFMEWWKQLFGESEGKDNKGIFPVSVGYTTDLHSLGQYVQEGERHLFETVIDIENPYRDIQFSIDENSHLNYLNGKTLNFANHSAMQGTITAHVEGGVPNLIIRVEKLDEYSIGELIYFFEKACAISGYLLNVNPFNQPGVEFYKKEMFRLLGKK